MSTNSDSNAVVAIFETHPEAEAAVQALNQAGFDMKKLSVVGKDYQANKYLVVAHGTAADVDHAREILQASNPTSLDEHVLSAAGQAVGV
jgi:hypothetical protein